MILILLLFLLCACEVSYTPPAATTVFSGNVLTMDYRIIIGKALDQDDKDDIDSVVYKTFMEINAIFNKSNPRSEISRLNKLKGNVRAKLSPPLYRLLVSAGNVVALTEGRFDPTVAAVNDLWQRKLELGGVPTDEEVNALSDSVGWHKIHYEGGIFFKDVDTLSLDLSGIAKGHCVDVIAERLSSLGHTDFFVEWGGHVRTSGKHPKGRPWALFIRGLDDAYNGQAVAYLHVKDRSIATSCDYLQNWTVSMPDGPATYFQIVDPFRLHPLISSEDSVATASVMVDNCALADALATALMTFSNTQTATAWAEQMKLKIPNLSYWVMSRREWQNASKSELEE
jgi:thiamine biosynthesis lipoprotein